MEQNNVFTIPGGWAAETVEPPLIDVTGISRRFMDIPYASQSPSQKLDIYLPEEGEGPFPTMIFIHGGGFFGGKKGDAQVGTILNAIRYGFAVVSVEYRLAGEAKYPAGLFDLKTAIRFLRANAAKYMLDGDRFAVGGTSAGGYYAVMAAATQDDPAFEDLSMGCASYSSRVQAVISWFGTFDLILQSKSFNNPDMPSFEALLCGAAPDAIPGLMYFTNPMNFLTPAFPPILLFHGDDDHIVPVEESRMLCRRLTEIKGGRDVQYVEREGFMHGDFGFMKPDMEAVAVEFLKKYLSA